LGTERRTIPSGLSVPFVENELISVGGIVRRS
jgi:hypothetical protein